jgi:hypothetical protein
MKKLVISLFIILFSLVFTFPAIADRQGRGGGDRQSQKVEKHYKQPPGHAYGYRYKYHGHRHYDPPHYRGHWRSWRSWHDHYENHRHLYRHHRYYREGGSLYVEIENEDGRFVFSIGR